MKSEWLCFCAVHEEMEIWLHSFATDIFRVRQSWRLRWIWAGSAEMGGVRWLLRSVLRYGVNCPHFALADALCQCEAQHYLLIGELLQALALVLVPGGNRDTWLQEPGVWQEGCHCAGGEGTQRTNEVVQTSIRPIW